jgi:hypothetical protein
MTMTSSMVAMLELRLCDRSITYREGEIVNTSRTRRRLALLVSASVILALLSWLMPRHAHAMVSGCRSDPVVSLSNLAQLDLSANISDSTSDVRQILYVMHGPVGTRVLLVVPTDGLLGLTEKFVYYADEPANTYDTYTTVTTGTPKVAVTATSLVTSLFNIGTVSAAGYSGQAIHIHL